MTKNREFPPMRTRIHALRIATLLPAVTLSLGLVASVTMAQEIPARLDWNERVHLGTPISGIVTTVDAGPGQQVKQGHVLVRMDDRAIRARLDENEAQVRRLELARAEAELEYERAQDLYDRTLISQRELSENEIAFAMADAELVAAKARLTRSRLDLEYSQLRAPFDAMVLSLHVRPGETVNNELQVTPMVILASTGPMLARGQIDEEGLVGLRQGQKVEVAVGERRYDGMVHSLGLEPVEAGEEPARYAVAVRFSPPAEHNLRAGLRATLTPVDD